MNLNRILLAALAIVALSTSPALASAPPSFALWTARSGNADDRMEATIAAPCLAKYATDDAKAGPCWVKRSIPALTIRIAQWSKGIAMISRGQTPQCRAAIHAYWLASKKARGAIMVYLRGHLDTPMTKVASGMQGEPYSTLDSLKDEVKAKAIRVCG